MNKYLPLLWLILISANVFAQKPKEARALDLKTKTTWITLKKGNKETNYKSSELRFSKSGELIEEITYNPKGNITKHIAYQYDKKTLVREIHFNRDGKIIQRIEYIYSKNILSEIQYYNAQSVLEKKEQFIYEQQE